MTDRPTWAQRMRASGLPRAEARLLMERASGRRREWLIAHADEPAEPAALAAFDRLAAARRAGEPIAYLLGEREFHGRRFEVGPAVLIPRPETELLCDEALAAAPASARVLDLGTGSGIIAITLAAERPDLTVVATDLSPDALAVARRNAARLLRPGAGGAAAPRTDAPASAPAATRPAAPAIQWRIGDWWAAVAAGDTFDLIVSNPPYIAAADEHLRRGDLRFEPPAALTDGADGLAAIRVIVAGAAKRLRPGGWLLLEHGHDQAQAVSALMQAAGFVDVRTRPDLSGLPRVTGGRRGHDGGPLGRRPAPQLPRGPSSCRPVRSTPACSRIDIYPSSTNASRWMRKNSFRKR